jgi:co-chaperonin GroES (HSP10)
MAKIIPLNKNILVEPEMETRVLATMPIERDFGKVISIGSEVKFLKVGDRICYLKFGIKRVDVSDTEKWLFISEDSPWLLGKVEDGTA